MKVWYLAHPIRGDKALTQERNIEQALKYLTVLHERGVAVQAPYLPNCMVADPNNNEMHVRGIEINTRVLAGYDGIILVGHKLSTGMRNEFNAFDGPVVNFIGFTPADIRSLDLSSLLEE